MGQVLTKTKKAVIALNGFLGNELGDYSQFKWKIEVEDELENEIYLDAEITNTSTNKTDIIRFYYSTEEDDLYIDMYDGNYEMIRSYDWQVKYFWIRFDLWN